MGRKQLIVLSAITAATACALCFAGCTVFGWGRQKDIVYRFSSDSQSYVVDKCYVRSGAKTEIVIPSEYDGKPVTEIGEFAFENCSKIKSVTIPDSVVNIGVYAFYGCESLEKVNIPEGVSSIGVLAFAKCAGLESITVAPENITFKSQNNCLLSKDGKTLVAGCKNSIVPDGVEQIARTAFEGCTNLTSVTLPDSLTSIGYGAFDGCSGLTRVTFGENLTEIDSYAFRFCFKLEDVTIPDGVTKIGDGAFQYCNSFTNIVIPEGVTSIGQEAFACCGAQSITVADGNKNYKSVNGCLLDIDGKTLHAGSDNGIIPDGVVKVASGAFASCKGLTEVNIPVGVKTVGGYAFGECTNLTSVTVPESVTSIENEAFYRCEGLTSVTIKNSEINVNAEAFYYCNKLTDINFNGTKEQWKAFEFERGTRWARKIGNYTVHCTDGDLKKSQLK